jgi:hypothetical protein
MTNGSMPSLRMPPPSRNEVGYDDLQGHVRISCYEALPEDEGAVNLAGYVGSCAVFQLDGEAAADAVRSLHDVVRVARFTTNTTTVPGSAVGQ